MRSLKRLSKSATSKLVVPQLAVPSADSPWFSCHTHSHFSVIDGTVPVPDLVRKAKLLGQQGLVLTDHGNMGGSVQLYQSCKAAGILPFPGIETYLLDPNADDQTDGKTKRFHAGLFALDYKGYQGLVKLSSLAHTRPRFWNKFARLMLSDLAQFGQEYGKHVVLTTGCFFGLVQQQIVSDNLQSAELTIKSYAQWFPHTFVELQNHGIVHDKESGMDDSQMVEVLYDIAQRNGLPVLATQDSHYADQSQKVAHGLMKRMVYRGADDEFPGDSFHLASADWVAEHYEPHVWEDVEDSCRWLLAHNRLTIPALDTFKAHVPSMAEDPMTVLKKKCRRLLAIMLSEMELSQAKRQKYVDRLEEELSVIEYVGMGNYFLLWDKFVKWCHEEGICIEARGSANGSLVCYLLGITQVDPIQWNTMFERFLSRDRKKPPDIDMDVESDRRQECVNWWRQFFTIVPIGNWSQLGSRDDGSDKGSVLVSYMSYLRTKSEQMAHDYWLDHEEYDDKGKKKVVYKVSPDTGKPMTKAAVMDYAKRIFFKRWGHIKTVEDVYEVSANDYYGLRELASTMNVLKSYGVHAAGILMDSPSLPIADNIPTMLVASSDTTVTQFDMDDVEQWGLLKNDLLGQKTLTIMRRCQEMIHEQYGDIPDATDFSWIPFNDRAACKLLREGRTDNGIFHFEGWTKAKGGKEMGIASTKDAVMATALYMPGATESGQKDHYLKFRRLGREGIMQQNYPHEAFAAVLTETYGAVVFQEQPIAILRILGMSMENINLLFKVVKDSGKGAVERNAERLATLRKEFDYICAKNNIEDVEHAWFLCTGFINYGFNRAHATGYGIRSYRCAYLKAHYPHEFMAALLETWAGASGKDRNGKTKEDLYAAEARRLDIRLLPPHVNESGLSWTLARRSNMEPRGIRRGLVSIKGMGDASAAEIAMKAPYTSIQDLVTRVSARSATGGAEYMKTGKLTGKLAALAQAKALENLSTKGHG